MEEFRIVKDYPNYSVSNFGNVKKNQTGKIIIPRYSNGYSQVELWNDNGKVFGVHRLVAIEFISNPENKPFVDHIDNDKANNNVNNLRWATIAEKGIWILDYMVKIMTKLVLSQLFRIVHSQRFFLTKMHSLNSLGS